MVIDHKDWTPEHHEAARTALQAHFARTQALSIPTCRPNSLEVVTRRIANGGLTACFIHGYLLIYDVGQAWSTEENIVYELLLVKAMPHGTFSDYVAGLKQLCARFDCYGIETGNGVLRPGLRRHYERAGFFKTNESYFLEVHNG